MTPRRRTRGAAVVRVINDNTSEAEGSQVIDALRALAVPYRRAGHAAAWAFAGRHTVDLLAALEARGVRIEVKL